jgi:hypothetical protein
MTYIRKAKGGKSQVMKSEAFCQLLDGHLPNEEAPIDKLFASFDDTITKFDNTITIDALKNVHGDWYQWLLAISAWNFCVEHENANLAMLTPKISQFDIGKLYNERLYKLIQDLRDKVLASSSVQLISSNPDFVIIDRKVDSIDLEVLNKIEQAHKKFEKQCAFEDIHGYIAVKTSFRPDRRLQIPHEGSLMKAIYTHIQTREWILNPNGIKYYAIATKVGEPDRQALKTVATHSITTVQSVPQAAVDNVFEINSLQQAEIAFAQILTSVPKSVS